MVYFNFMKEIMLCMNTIKKDFKQGGATELNHSEALLIWSIYTASGKVYKLSEILGKDSSQVYRELKKLEGKDLIKKDSYETGISYILTDKGREVVEAMKASVGEFEKLHPEFCRKAEKVTKDLKEMREEFAEVLNLK